MHKRPTISIAMTTYNGGKYLREQLESISSQSQLPSELVVCDDGSTDNTLEILTDFAFSAPFQVRIYVNQTNVGFAANFFKSASLCNGDFIAFCDQDDVWLPNKLRDVHEAIEKNPETQIVLQNSYICNERLDRSKRFFPNAIPPGRYGKQSQFGFWVWPGFLQSVRASLIESIGRTDRPRSYYPHDSLLTHDKFTCLLANALGGIVVLREPAALYRRHSRAVTGDYAVQTLRQRLDKALPVGSDHYAFLAEVSDETADYLRRLAEDSDPAKASNLRASAASFDKLSSIHATRADLYSASNATVRLRHYARIARSGGYVGPPMISLGWKSAAKDLLRVVGLLGTSQSGHSS